MLKPYLFIDKSSKMGRGVFTRERIPAGTVIEISPVIVMDKKDKEYLDKTLLHNYIFEWGKQKDKCCMALGLIPMYNHNYKSNCEYFMDFEDETIFPNGSVQFDNTLLMKKIKHEWRSVEQK